VVYGDAHRIFQQQELERQLTHSQPDYLLVQVYAGSGKSVFELLQRYPKIKVISLEHLLLQQESREVGLPGQNYLNWIAELTFDNQKASRLLSEYLLQTCESNGQNGRGGIVGVNGLYGKEAQQRQAGLVESLVGNEQFVLHQVVKAKWQREVAQQMSRALLMRYPDTSIIWSASDWMALGVADSLSGVMRKEQSFCIGGFDWIPEIVPAIKSGKVTASVGGHYLIGAWAMVAIYDHLNGALPGDINRLNPVLTMQLMHQQNVARIAPLLDPEAWKDFDFRSYSLHHHPNQKKYRFRLPEN